MLYVMRIGTYGYHYIIEEKYERKGSAMEKRINLRIEDTHKYIHNMQS
jgi:hypothetical protein